MISQESFHRILYIEIGLIIAATVILVLLILPPSTIPQSYVNNYWLMVIIHFLSIGTLLWTIQIDKRGEERKELQVIIGVVFIVFGLIFLDHAFAFQNRPEQPPRISFGLFVCVGCDLAAGLLILVGRYFRRNRAPIRVDKSILN